MLDFLIHQNSVNLPTSLLKRCIYVNDAYLHTPYGSKLEQVQTALTLEAAINNLATQNEFKFDDDVFDCVTYVETILGILLSSQLAKNDAEFLTCVQSLRYEHGLPFFLRRNHFFGADWIVNNSWCVEFSTIMYRYFNDTRVASAIINRHNWLFKHRVLQSVINDKVQPQDLSLLLKRINYDFSPKVHEIRYLPLEFMLNNWNEVESCLPILFLAVMIRPNWNLIDKIGTCLNVSHVGVGLRVDNELIFYHASSVEKMVVKVNLRDYLEYCKEITTIDGVVFLESKQFNF